MSAYVGLPVTHEKIHGAFRSAEGKPLSEEEEAYVAAEIDKRVRQENETLWMTPGVDSREAKAFGETLRLRGETALRYILKVEGAVFPYENLA